VPEVAVVGAEDEVPGVVVPCSRKRQGRLNTRGVSFRSASTREVIEHERLGIDIHLFVREAKLSGGKGAAFTYAGKARYRSHTGSAPMSVIFDVQPAASRGGA